MGTIQKFGEASLAKYTMLEIPSQSLYLTQKACHKHGDSAGVTVADRILLKLYPTVLQR